MVPHAYVSLYQGLLGVARYLTSQTPFKHCHPFLQVGRQYLTRSELDIAKSSLLPFHMLFSSQLLGHTKVFKSSHLRDHDESKQHQPDLAIYNKAMDLMQLRPEDCVMVAAHAYDLRAAKQA